MNETNDCDYDIDDDGAWETVSKNKKTRDKIKMDQRPVAADRKSFPKRIKTVGSAGTRRPLKQSNPPSGGRKTVPSTNWREAARKKESTEMQKRVILKNVQIGRSAKPPATPAKKDTTNLPCRGAAAGETVTTKDTNVRKFDSFEEYDQTFPDLQKAEEETVAPIQSPPVQHYANVQSFYESNGYEVTEDVMQALNAMIMNNPRIPSLLDPSLGQGDVTQMNVVEHGYPITDVLANNSYLDNGSYTGVTSDIGFKDRNKFLPAEPTGGGIDVNPHENHFNILANEVLQGALDTRETKEGGQETKDMNALLNFNLLSQSVEAGKEIAEKPVVGEEPALDSGEKNTNTESTRKLVQNNDTTSVIRKRIPLKRKRIKEQGKSRHKESQEQNTVLVKQGSNIMEVSQDDQKEMSTPRESIAILHSDIKSKLDEMIDTGNDGNVNMNDRITVDSNANEIVLTDSNSVFKSDNQNNNCQDAGASEDDSCLELTGMESMCIPDCFETEVIVCSRCEEKATDKTADAGDSGTLQRNTEMVCPEETTPSRETKKAEETSTEEPIQMVIECVQTDLASEKEMKKVKVVDEIPNAEMEENKQDITKDDTKDNPNTDCLEKKQVECIDAVKEEPELTADRKLTYGDVIEYVMKQLKDLYSGKDSFLPVTKIEHDALPEELTGHLNVLRQLATNYTPSFHQYDTTSKGCSESSYSDSSDSSEDSTEDFEVTTSTGFPETDMDKTLLKRFHEKLHVFAQLNHLHQVVSHPTLAAMVDDYKLMENEELLTSYGCDFFPDLNTNSLSRSESAGKSSTLGVQMEKGPWGNISGVQTEEGSTKPCTMFDNGNARDMIENFVTTGTNPVEDGHAHQQLSTKDPTFTNSAADIPLPEERDGHCFKTKDGPGEASLNSLLSSPHLTSAKGLEFFQHSFLSSPENVSDDAIVSLQANSDINAPDVKESFEGSSRLVDIRCFLSSQLKCIEESLDREILNSMTSRQREHEGDAGQGGDTMRRSRRVLGCNKEQTAESPTKDKTGEKVDDTTEYHIDDEDLLFKGWMDKTLVECLANPSDEVTKDNRNRRQYRTKKFRALPYWWMP